MTLPCPPNLALVGATGAVGRELLLILEQRGFPLGSVRLLASPRSAGAVLRVGNAELPVEAVAEGSLDGVDLAFLAAGSSLSHMLAPPAVRTGCTVIDTTSAFRGDPQVPLVVPEINGDVLDAFEPPGIIAGPNCTTTIVLIAATPLHRAAGIERIVVSTYQAASGAGAAVLHELQQQACDFATGRAFTTLVTGRQYLFNVFSHDSPVGPDGDNEEERKLRTETARLWPGETPAIAATCVRVPVLRAHCAAMTLTLRTPLEESEARTLLREAPGVRIVDDREANRFPEPVDATGQDDVLVGRIRADASQPPGLGLQLFVSGDQLRKGAALNAVQIAERLIASPVGA